MRADGRVCVRRAATMPARAGNLLRLAARRVQGAPGLRAKAPLRGGAEGPDPNAVSLSWLPAPPRSLAPPAPPNAPPTPPPPPHNCVGRRRGCLVGWRTAASVLASPATAWRDSPPSFALPWDGLAWCLAPVTAQISESRLNDAPPSVRALSRAQPKWEQAVRRVLRKDEHVVFAVIGGWVRAALCKKVGSRNLTVPEFTGASRSLRSLRVLHAFG